MAKGASAMCPGCLIERQVPTKTNLGCAVHYMDKAKTRSYECHANTDVWKDVPEFRDQ